MRIAKNINGDYVWVTSQEQGYCPDCNEKLITKSGAQVAAYYSHLPSTYCRIASGEKTEWHIIWQSKFDKTEIYSKDKKNIADVMLKNGTVLEFQNSNIDLLTMRQREAQWDKMIWLFNLTNSQVKITNNKMVWLRPKKGFLYFVKPAFFHVINHVIVKLKNIDFTYEQTKYRRECTLICDVIKYAPDEWIKECNNGFN